ncbi:hypothetical protein ACFOKF_14030 [Sphingobium rhizovicinum]|uniref:DUF732 domain-containing protein n=1 Tax=Sphingobium rhizovicinum TaxID=432308 RepID=A0ABV7NG51_9SPHN
MSGRVVLVPVMLMLALTAGCRSSSDDSAQADNGAAPALPAMATAPTDLSPPPAPLAEPARPAPTVTVRAQPAPRNVLDLPPSDDGLSAEPFPQEVTAFMVDRDGCDHFRGEEPYDAERRAYIAESVAELCTGTDARLATLRRRYANDPSVIAALRAYDDRIESVATY